MDGKKQFTIRKRLATHTQTNDKAQLKKIYHPPFAPFGKCARKSDEEKLSTVRVCLCVLFLFWLFK